MTSYPNQFKTGEIVSSRYENGELLVTAKGMQGEIFEDIVWNDPPGFHYRPKKGDDIRIHAPGGRMDMAFAMAKNTPGKYPELAEGESAMYADGGGVVTLKPDGWHFSTDLHIDGNIIMTGGITAGGSIVDGDGNNGA